MPASPSPYDLGRDLSRAVLALVPGGSLTLTLNDAYYWENLSEVVWPLEIGTAIYAQVDSAHAETDYGAVLETHEIIGGEYNNIFGPVYVIANQSTAAPRATNPVVGPTQSMELPDRPY